VREESREVLRSLYKIRRNDFQISPPQVYKDDGFSGARLDRPALDCLRDAVAQGEVEAVLNLFCFYCLDLFGDQCTANRKSAVHFGK